MFPGSCFCFTTGQGEENFITCVLMGLEDYAPKRFSSVHLLQVSFGQCRPPAASQASPGTSMEVLHKFAPMSSTGQ